ncbi:Glutamate mutase sigma subunit [subsurface metagenome]
MSIDTLENLKKAIMEYDSKGAATWARKAVEEGIDPIKALDAMTVAIRQVGDGFGSGELWLPDLIGAADAMSAATPIIEEEIKRIGIKRESLGTVVIGTVYGDIHTIGKTMVATLLTADGFQVYDVGINVTGQKFLEAVKKYKPDILAMSALMTMTAPEQKKVIETLKKEGLRGKVKVMVGGGAITQEFADSIGADGYGPTAPAAAKLARKIVEK